MPGGLLQQIVWQEACLSAAAPGPPCGGPQSGRSVKRSRVETPEKVRAERDSETRSHIHVLSGTLIPKRSSWGGVCAPQSGDTPALSDDETTYDHIPTLPVVPEPLAPRKGPGE